MDYSQTSATDAGMFAALGAFLFIGLAIGLAIYLLVGYSFGKLFERAGKPMWAGFVPIYNIFVWVEIIGRPWFWALLLIAVGFIPFIGWIAQIGVAIILGIDTAKSFGKDTVYGVLIGLFSFIMIPVLAFSGAQYVGPSAAGKTGVDL